MTSRTDSRGRDDEPVLRVGAEVEVAVAAADPVVEGDPQAEVGVAADERLPLVAGHRHRAQVEPADQAEDLLEEGRVWPGSCATMLPAVAQPPGVAGTAARPGASG